MAIKKLKCFINGDWHESKTTRYMDCYNPSTGEVMAQAPQCTSEEVEAAVAAAQAAFPAWADTPPNTRVQVLFRMKALLDKHLDELTLLVATENGKVWDEAKGDVLKVTEVVEFACGIPHLMLGPALMNCTRRSLIPDNLLPPGKSPEDARREWSKRITQLEIMGVR